MYVVFVVVMACQGSDGPPESDQRTFAAAAFRDFFLGTAEGDLLIDCLIDRFDWLVGRHAVRRLVNGVAGGPSVVSRGGKSDYQNNNVEYILHVSRCATLLLVLPQTIQYSGDFYEVPGAVGVIVVTLKKSIDSTLGTVVVIGRQNKQRQMRAIIILL